MSLIDLKLIHELYLEAADSHNRLLECCYNWNDSIQELDSNALATLVITHTQAKNLDRGLYVLHQICTDFAAGHLERYEQKHRELFGPDSARAYDPFEELEADFIGDSPYDLPPTIEQYGPLVKLASQFSQIKQMKREGIEGKFKPAPQYLKITNDQGEIIHVPQAYVPAPIWLRHEYERDIEEIQVEYCLDHYNQFYAKVVELIRSYRLTGDYQTCAREILALYKAC
ncbi:hypothetical protein LX87_03164 [Larkinella arboricola]|uniref:Uncharacterized protein n=1 Tax=Larkinella arboricola TaxID=643671 RepID=A0A327WZS1_LARAB|nr:hypothetical protein [Larkinella arboricola]RAJ95419.1 hypothetical protein LX87_03164 [Larkinella arboricola]